MRAALSALLRDVLAKVRDEPVLVTQAVAAVVALAAAFGLALPAGAGAALASLAAVLAALVARRKVTPTARAGTSL